MGVCNCSMFCCTLLYVHSSIAITLMGKRELIALLNLSSWCLVMVERLFLAVPRGCLQFVIVVFPDHTHLLLLTKMRQLLQFEEWRQTYSIQKTLWLKRTSTSPLRGFTDDQEHVPEASRCTMEQKIAHLELMLGQIANYCPIISRSSIVKSSTSVNQILANHTITF